MSYDLSRIDIGKLETLGAVFADSGCFGKADVAAAMVKVMAGQELGLGPFQAMASIHVIHGRAVVSANTIARAVKGHARYDYRIRERSATVCAIEFFEKHDDGRLESLGTERWDTARAKRAGLTSKNWTAYPEAMLFARCISSGYRAFCPDALTLTTYVEGELDDAPPAPMPTVQTLDSRIPDHRAEPIRNVEVSVTPTPDADGELAINLGDKVERRPLNPMDRPDEIERQAHIVTGIAVGPDYILKAGDYGVRADDEGMTARDCVAWQGFAVSMATKDKADGRPVEGRDRKMVSLAHALRKERKARYESEKSELIAEFAKLAPDGDYKTIAKDLDIPKRRALENYDVDELAAIVAYARERLDEDTAEREGMSE